MFSFDFKYHKTITNMYIKSFHLIIIKDQFKFDFKFHIKRRTLARGNHVWLGYGVECRNATKFDFTPLCHFPLPLLTCSFILPLPPYPIFLPSELLIICGGEGEISPHFLCVCMFVVAFLMFSSECVCICVRVCVCVCLLVCMCVHL